MTHHRISILGCGWLGFPLAQQLVANNHFVRGSTTTKEKIPLLEESGIEPYFLTLDPRLSGDDITSFFDVDTVVLNIPPPRVDNRIAVMQQQANELISYLNASPVKRVIMVSSTSVYGFKNQDADENDAHPAETENGKGLVEMERMLMQGLNAIVAVVRMAGLIGPDRHPGRFMAGKEVGGNGEEPVNLIHQDDAIGVVDALIRQPEISGVFNACAREHPTRREVYVNAAENLGYEPPVFRDSSPRPWKRIISKKIRETTGYSFAYDDPASPEMFR